MAEKILKKTDYEKKLDLSEQVTREEITPIGLVLEAGGVLRKGVHEATGQAQKIIDQAKLESTRIKKEAQDILNRVKEETEAAKKEGFVTGREEGLSQTTELLVKATHQKEKMFEGFEKNVVKLVYDIAEKILGREMTDRETAIVDLVKQALHAALGQKIMVFVNPADINVVKKNHPLFMQVLDASKTLQMRADDKVAPHGCVIETEIGTIDAQLETQLAAIRKALGLVEETAPLPARDEEETVSLEDE